MHKDEFVKEAKSRFSEFRSDLEELNVKAALGASEFRETFEREWGKFSNFMEDQGHRLRRRSTWANRLTGQMAERLETLRKLVGSEKPSAERQFNGWRESVAANIYQIEYFIGELFPVLHDDERDLFGMLRVKMELYRSHLMLSTFDNLAKLDQMATEMAEKAEEVADWRMKLANEEREKIERFREGIRTTFSHLKNTFSELVK